MSRSTRNNDLFRGPRPASRLTGPRNVKSRTTWAGTPEAPIQHNLVVPGMSRFRNGCPLCEATTEGSGLTGNAGCPACQLVTEITDRRPAAFE